MNTCWFLCVRPFGSRNAALQKYCTQPCLPKNVEGSPKGNPNLNGKLCIPGDSTDGSASTNKDYIISLLYYCIVTVKILPDSPKSLILKSI